MLKQLIFGSQKNHDSTLGVWVGLILGIIAGLTMYFVGFLWGFFLFCVVLCVFVDGRFVVGGVWFVDGFDGLSRGVIIGTPLAAAFAAFFTNITLAWYFALNIFILTEIIFWFFDEAKPSKKENIIFFTIKRKLACLIHTIIIYVGVVGTFRLCRQIIPQIKEAFPEILKWVGYIGIGLIAISCIALILYVVFYLNSLKYKRRK